MYVSERTLNMSGVENKNRESGLLFCVNYSSTLQGR